MNQGMRLLVYPVKDSAKAKALYRELLGVEQYADAPYYVGFKIGELEIGLDPHAKTSGPLAYLDREARRTGATKASGPTALPSVDSRRKWETPGLATPTTLRTIRAGLHLLDSNHLDFESRRSSNVGDKELLQVARHIAEAFNAADWDAYSALLTTDTVFETPTTRSQGPDEILRHVRGVKAAFPDMKVTVTKALACDDTVVEELSVEGTHGGPIQTPRGPIPATNRTVKFKTVMLFEFANGKLVAYREYFDRAGLMAQLGIGAPAPAGAVTDREGPGTP